MNISPLLLAVRAIASEFARRIYFPVSFIIAGIMASFTVLFVWLVNVSAWWWLLFAPFLIASFALVIVMLAVGLFIKFVSPSQTKAQNKQIRGFVDKIQSTSEAVQTPKFILLFKLVKDVFRPSERSFVRELSTNATSLRGDFQDVVNSFK